MKPETCFTYALINGLIFLSILPAKAQVKKLNAETAIQQVTIFSSGARVERSSAVNIQTGRSEISFAGLSNQLDQPTIQLKADASITLLSVQTTKDFLTERKIEQEERGFIDRTNSLKDKFEMDTKLLDVYKNEEAMLIKNQAIGGQTGVKTIELKEALEFQRQRLTEVYGKELEIQKRLLTEQHDIERNKAQLQEISKKRDSINYVVTALIESKETRTVNFQIFYNVKDAGWYPTYDVRVNEITEPLNVLMNANVFQRSGETWKNIPLQLSTGNPNDNATPSLLQPWMLGYYDPSVSMINQGTHGEISGRITTENGEPIDGATVVIKGTRMAVITDANGFFKFQNVAFNGVISITYIGYESKLVSVRPGYYSIVLKQSSTALNDAVVVGYIAGLEVSGAVRSVSSDKEKNAIQTVTVATQYQPTTTVYRIENRYTLESDGKTSTIGIREFEIPAIYDYYAAPKIDPAAFLTAKIVNWQDYEWQSGEVSLYFEGAYLGKTYLDLSAVSDTLSLSLGKDNGVKISRKLLKEYSAKKFIGSNRTDNRQYEIIVRNSKKVPVNITLVDQIPVSTTKEISVDDMKTGEGQLNKETGMINWILSLAPGQERKAGFSYVVKYPKDRKLLLE